MGFYIQTKGSFNKAHNIAFEYNGLVLDHTPRWKDIPQGKAAICVVKNPGFEAAAFAFNEAEFNQFCDQTNDPRPRTWVLIPWDKAVELTGYTP